MPTKVVFVTSERYSGNLGGIEGADAKCEASAKAGNLSGTFLAWISNASVSPSSRFEPSLDPYIRVDGVIFAESYDSLVIDFPLVPLNVTEAGLLVPAGRDDAIVWTNTESDGVLVSSTFDCNGWTVDDMTSTGTTGLISNLEAWSFDARNFCNTERRLYCFEQ